MAFRVEENADTKIIKDLFVEYSHLIIGQKSGASYLV